MEPRAYLAVRTSDGAATIASVAVSTGCSATAICVPGSATPCTEVDVNAVAASSCTVTLTSVDARTVSVTADVVPGASYDCRDGTGRIITAQRSAFDPAMIDIDFSTASVPDGGTD
jgi:hypothetical protein